MPASHELARQQQGLALAAAPAAFSVHLEDSDGHGTTSSAASDARKLARDVHRILLVALDNLGDLVFASALAPPLRDAFPRATIDIWCKRYTADVARLIPCVEGVVAADPFWAVHPQHRRPPMWPFLRSMLEIKRRQYDLAVLSEAPWRAAAAVAATRIPVRIGSARHRNARFLTHVVPAEDPHKPVVAEQARLLEPLGIRSHDPRYRLDASRLGALRERIAELLPERFAAMHPFASLPRKRASLEAWLPVADALEARGLPVLWIGTRAELDALRATYRPDALCIDQLHDGSLAASAAALSLASVFVGHDSGPMHTAGAFGVPVVAVFVTGSPVRYGPQGVGPSRTLFASQASEIDSAEIIRAIDSLAVVSSA
jgi:ADP-heptose:LPS heptosyltransferase